MSKRLLHTPEGVRDIYGEEYSKKVKIQSLIHEKMKQYGYEDIQTPTFEFFDVFSKEIGTTPSKELYKFFDQEGNTLVLRPDFTPSIARCAAKYYSNFDVPVRLGYVGNTFTNTSNLQGKLKEVTQMGGELIGDDSVESDAEMIALVIDALRNTGLKDFQVSIGDVDYFKGLCADAGLDEETELDLRDLISIKNFFGAEELLNNSSVSESIKQSILKLYDLFGNADILKQAKEIAHNDISLKAIERLYKLYDMLCIYGVETYVSFDLGMLSKYNYYTGVIFKAYTYGVGDAVVKGGRYDTLLSKFGKDAPAIGFVFSIDDLMAALSRQNISLHVKHETILILFDEKCYKDSILLACKLRFLGKTVEVVKCEETCDVEQYVIYAKNRQMAEVYFNGNQIL